MNNIGKVVFYNFLKDGQKVERAHIFYKDGSDEDVSKYDGLKAFETIAMEENIDTNDNEQLESIYNKRIFVMEYKDLINNFNSFKYKDNSDIVVNKVISDEVDEVNNNEVALDENDYEDYFEDEIVEEKFPKVKGALNRAKNKIKNTSLAKKITVTAIGVAVLFGLHSVLSKGSKSGEMYDSNLPVSQSVSDKLNDSAGDSIVVSSTFDRLLQQCQSEVQKNTMKLVGENLDYFNGTFADKFVENGKNVRAALNWDEMMSLIVAYNDYSVEDIKTIFNGYNITLSEDFAESFYKSYQNAFLQLEGAYILETSDTQVNIEKYITSEEGKKFVREYHELFLNAKQATGKEKLALVKEFYTKLRKDFSITDEVCRPGISHADANVQTRHYMLAIAPMVSAAENLFQNLETDYTLNDQEVKYFNEYGLCNIAKDMFQKVEFVLLNNSSEVTGVKYLEFKEQKIKELISSSRYVIDDAHRNLFELDAFMRAITVQNECFEEYNSSSTTKSSKSSSSNSRTTSTKTTTKSNTTYRTETTTKTTSSRTEAINKAGVSAVEKAEQAVNTKIEQENQEAKRNAEIKAEETRQTLQNEADKQAEKNKQEVEQYNNALQPKIDKANENINSGKTVNEKDFTDHNVKFDTDHSDSKGNLDNSVKNITTDGSNSSSKTDALPDPNKTGAEFDAKSQKSSSTTINNSSSSSSSSSNSSSTTSTSSSSSTISENFYTEVVTVPVKTNEVTSTPVSTVTSTESVKKSAGQTIIEYEEPVKTNEQIVDEYIKSLEQSNCDDTAKVYTK